MSDGAESILGGSARKFDATASVGASVKARQLVAENCTANASTGSNIYVNASRELRMDASLDSTIYYVGSAKVLAQSESVGSAIKRKD